MGRPRKPRAQAKADTQAPPAAAAARPVSAASFDRMLLQWAIPLVLIVAGLAAFHNSLHGAFLLDDFGRIVNNPRVHQLSPLGTVLDQSSRPFVQFTLALNWVLGGEDTWGFHALNLAAHLIAGLALFGIVRRMLASEDLRERYGRAAPWLALAVAGIWLVHPLQTQAVNYVIQRAESMMGMFFLLTLYCGVRACEGERATGWSVAAVAACALGMGSKEVMVVAPVLVWLHDRMFYARSIADTFRRRWGLYLGLAGTWLVLGVALLSVASERQTMLADGIDRWSYALSQADVLVHYLRLAFWPHPLTFDYAWPVASPLSSVWPAALVIAALLAGTAVALWQRWWPGYWGAWFFVILAPTSSIVPIADLAVEHRMYLPLAAVVVVFVVGGHRLLGVVAEKIPAFGTARGWAEIGAAVLVVVALGATTVRRNDDYATAVAMWTDTVAKRPANPRAHLSLGVSLSRQGNFRDADTHFREALRLKPDYPDAHRLYAGSLVTEGRDADAIAHFEAALKIEPAPSEPQNLHGAALLRQGRVDEAIGRFREALARRPDYPQAHNNLGVALAGQGKIAEAAEHFAAAVRLQPGYTDARNNLQRAQADLRRSKGTP